MATAAVYALLLAQQAVAGQRARLVIVGALVAGGAALTKQAGLFIAAVYPILTWLLVYRATNTSRGRERLWRMPLATAAILVTVVLPFYLVTQWAISTGQEASITQLLLNDMHEGRNLGERLLHALGLLRQPLGSPLLILLVVAILAGLRDKTARVLLLVVVVPFLFIWALGFSYDLRNIALVLPFAGMATGTGLVELLGIGQKTIVALGKGNVPSSSNENSGRPSLVSWPILGRVMNTRRPGPFPNPRYVAAP